MVAAANMVEVAALGPEIRRAQPIPAALMGGQALTAGELASLSRSPRRPRVGILRG